jgi:molybdenum cofactor cytidylyltransferase
MNVFELHSECSIVIPRYRGERGNPIVFAAAYAPEVVAGRRLIGCRKLAEQYPDETWYHEAVHDRYTTDLDTAEDYQRLLERFETAEPGPSMRPVGLTSP